MSRDDLAARLRAIFATELEETVRAANGHLLALEANPADANEQRALFRVMHTLKGAARAAGVPAVEAACHHFETLLADVRDGRRVLEAALFAQLFAGVDALGDAGARLARGEPVDEAVLEAAVATAAPTRVPDPIPGRREGQGGRDREREAGTVGPMGDAGAPPDVVPSTPPNVVPHAVPNVPPNAPPHAAPPVPPSTAPDAALPTPSDATRVAPMRATEAAAPALPAAGEIPEAPAPATVPASASAAGESVRVDTGRLDELLVAATRLLIASGQLDRMPETLRRLHESLGHAARQAHALVRATRATATPTAPVAGDGGAHAEARASVLAASLDELLGTLASEAGAVAESTEGAARDLTAVAADVATGVRALRLRPFADAVEELPRVVRDVAAATGKPVRLHVRGDDVEADRAVLGYVREALLHLVRNAVDHGIEAPAERAARGKPAEATVRVAAELLGDRLVVTVSDDGKGIDVAAVRARLAALGEEVPASDREVARRLFTGGVSTRQHASAISGRGVGLDAVRAAVQQARGGVDVAWTPGIGTTFTLEVPLTLVTIRALLVRVGAHLAALPTAHVERVLLLRPDDVAVVEGSAAVRTSGAPAPLASLARVLGPPLVERPPANPTDARPAVLLRVGGRQLALAVEELVDEREVVVRPIMGRGRHPVPHVSGAALLTSGEVALVLDASSVVSAGLGTGTDIEESAVAGTAARTRRILVVDDSITTRTLEQSVLEAAGYDVLTGVDGADGWRVLQERGADLVVSDVEMPRMDGLDLCRRIRASKQFRELPVILITALGSPEDRARGLEAGADAYLSKATFDQQGLLDTIHELVG